MSITVKNASSEFISSLAKEYLENDFVTFEKLAKFYDLSPKTISALLYKGIAEDILSNNVSERIYQKVVYSSDKGINQRKLRWEKAFDARDMLKYNQKMKKKLTDEINFIEFQISTFDETVSDDEVSIEQLQNKLFKLNLKLSQI